MTRFINCEVCQTEGRILTNDGGPDDVDHGACPECNGTRVVEVETQPITLADLSIRPAIRKSEHERRRFIRSAAIDPQAYAAW